MQTPLPEQDGPSAGSMSTLELMSSKEVAYQMTLYEWELFSCVHEVNMHTFTFIHFEDASRLQELKPKIVMTKTPLMQVLYVMLYAICFHN